MARIRTIKPTFWTDEKIGLLPRAVRLTFLGLISAMADDHGRLVASARVIRSAVYPYDDDISTAEVAEHIKELERARRVIRYTVKGDDYLFIRHWFEHQRVDKPSKSMLPPPPPDDSPNAPRILREDSSNPPRAFAPERSGAERNGEEEKESGAERSGVEGLARVAENSPPYRLQPDPDPTIRDADRAAAPAPLVELPADAERLVEQLYSLATQKRQLDVRRQLYDALDPRLKGARLRRGVYAKARSPEHLAACCRAVLDDPPRNIDAAIVIVLEKLLDPPPGPTPAELHKASEDERVRLEEVYERNARNAGARWARAHSAEYETILTQLAREFPDAETGEFMRMAYEAARTQRCARAAGFPDYTSWCKTSGTQRADDPAAKGVA